MRIIAADDEPYALEALVREIKAAKPEAELAAFQEPEELLEYGKNHSCDVAFLDIEMGTMSGIEMAKRLKIWNPQVNIIFVTAYNQYVYQAIKLRMSGYVEKPVTKAAIQEELENLRNPIPAEKDVLVAKCFGDFEVFVNGKVLEFEKAKSKEMLAYLIHRRGSSVTSGELRGILWKNVTTDENTRSYLSKLKKDLRETLRNAGVEDVLVNSVRKYAIDPNKIRCDYYDYLDNKPEGVRAYNGEYMAQYSWGEIQNVILQDGLQ